MKSLLLYLSYCIMEKCQESAGHYQVADTISCVITEEAP